MAEKLQNLDPTTSVSAGDLLYTVVDPAGTPLDKKITVANVKTSLGLTGTNSGDQTSIVGITGTTAEFNAALSDGSFATGGGTVTGTSSGTNTGDQTSIVGIGGTKAEFDSAVSDGNFLFSGDVTQYTDEMAQDATGAMVNSTLTYVDVTPALGINLNNANTWTADQSVPDDAYDATTWNGNMEVPTKNAIRDKIETLSGGSYPILQPNARSISLGVNALNSITTGDDNVSIGYDSLTAGSGINNATAVGNYSLATATGGGASNCVAIGYTAMRYVTGAGEAVAIGSGAMGGNGTYSGADWSVAIGTDALSNASTTGSMNVAIGRRAGAALTSGGQNILIGSRVAESLSSGGQNIGIGYFIDFPSNTASNQLKIGEGILGQNIYTIGTSVLGFGIASSTSSTLTLRGGTTTISSLRITSGVAPTSPVDGDIWYDGTDIKMRVGGTTKTFTLV